MRTLVLAFVASVMACTSPPPTPQSAPTISPAITEGVATPPNSGESEALKRAAALAEDMKRREAEFKKLEESTPRENPAALLQAHLAAAEERVALEVSAAAMADPKRQEAISALKAVTSALSAGATRNQFREYFIAAKIKVDALAQVPENRPIRRVADIFNDALTLSVAYLTEELSANEVYRLKTKYRADGRFLSLFDVPMEGFSRTVSTSLRQKTGAISADAGAQWLIAKASSELDVLK